MQQKHFEHRGKTWSTIGGSIIPKLLQTFFRNTLFFHTEKLDFLQNFKIFNNLLNSLII